MRTIIVIIAFTAIMAINVIMALDVIVVLEIDGKALEERVQNLGSDGGIDVRREE